METSPANMVPCRSLRNRPQCDASVKKIYIVDITKGWCTSFYRVYDSFYVLCFSIFGFTSHLSASGRPTFQPELQPALQPPGRWSTSKTPPQTYSSELHGATRHTKLMSKMCILISVSGTSNVYNQIPCKELDLKEWWFMLKGGIVLLQLESK